MTRPGKPVANVGSPPTINKSTALLLAESLTDHCRRWSNEAASAHWSGPSRRRQFMIEAQRRHAVAAAQALHYRDKAIEAWKEVGR